MENLYIIIDHKDEEVAANYLDRKGILFEIFNDRYCEELGISEEMNKFKSSKIAKTLPDIVLETLRGIYYKLKEYNKLPNKGKFIIIEGPDGIGKSTLIKNIKEYMKENNKDMYDKTIFTTEPGSPLCSINKHLKDFIKMNNDIPVNDESLYHAFIADRINHWNMVILPYLNNGYNVITDRSFVSTMVYQDKSIKESILGSNGYLNMVSYIYILTASDSMFNNELINRDKNDNIEKSKDLYEINDRYREINLSNTPHSIYELNSSEDYSYIFDDIINSVIEKIQS